MMNSAILIKKSFLLLLILSCFLNACEKKPNDTEEKKPAVEKEIAVEQKAEASQNTIQLLTSADKQIEGIQVVYVSHEYNWKPGSNKIKTRLIGDESVKEEIELKDIKQIHVKRIEFDDDPRIGAKRIEVDFVKGSETIKGISVPLGAFAVQLYIILPDDFPISELSQYFKPLTGFHVNPEHQIIEGKNWLRVPLVQIKSLIIKQ